MKLTFGNRAMWDSQSLGVDCLGAYTVYLQVYIGISPDAIKIAVIMWSTAIGRGLVL